MCCRSPRACRRRSRAWTIARESSTSITTPTWSCSMSGWKSSASWYAAMKWETFDSYEALSARAAEIFLRAIHDDPRVVFGLPTGRTPIGMYDRVVAICSREYTCFQEVTTFNLDEYAGIACDHPGSYCTYMHEHLFDHVDLDPKRAHIPDGKAADLAAECAHYERTIRQAGGLGITFLG